MLWRCMGRFTKINTTDVYRKTIRSVLADPNSGDVTGFDNGRLDRPAYVIFLMRHVILPDSPYLRR